MSQNMLGSVTLADVAGLIKDLFDKLGSKRGEWWLSALKKFLREESPFEVDMSTEAQLKRWRILLYEYFGFALRGVEIPERKPGFDRLIVVPKWLHINKVLREMKKRFDVLDECLSNIESDRTNESTYAIWVRDVVEADEEHASKSADKLKKEGVKGIILIERLLHELIYHSETGKHLDVENITLCSGSRSSDGDVPYVRWYPGARELRVNWCFPGSAGGYLRAREVVS